MQEGTLYHFGIIISNTHMAWMRAVCGRLEMRYQYSINVVYNNFPWPNLTEKQKSVIEKASQNILDVRHDYPDSSLADLYDPLTMPLDLVKAHSNLDKEVKKAYGKNWKNETECVTDLFQCYKKIIDPYKLKNIARKKLS